MKYIKLNDDIENLKEIIADEQKSLQKIKNETAIKIEELEKEYDNNKHELNLKISEVESELDEKNEKLKI